MLKDNWEQNILTEEPGTQKQEQNTDLLEKPLLSSGYIMLSMLIPHSCANEFQLFGQNMFIYLFSNNENYNKGKNNDLLCT